MISADWGIWPERGSIHPIQGVWRENEVMIFAAHVRLIRAMRRMASPEGSVQRDLESSQSNQLRVPCCLAHVGQGLACPHFIEP